jgi:hypothetical protein
MHVGLALEGKPSILIVILRGGHERHRRTRRRPTHGPRLPPQDTGLASGARHQRTVAYLSISLSLDQ